MHQDGFNQKRSKYFDKRARELSEQSNPKTEGGLLEEEGLKTAGFLAASKQHLDLEL